MVIYFSGTGNSRYAAQSIAQHTKDKLISANEYIKTAHKADFCSERPFVFVSPTYAWRIPRVFSSFIEEGSFRCSASAYFIMTCGDDIGNAGASLEELCAKKGLIYKGVFPLVMPENYIAVFEATEKAEAKLLITEADKTLKAVSDYIQKGQDFAKPKISAADRLKSSVFNPIFYSLVVKAKGFYATDKCVSCGKCEELCPLNNIRLQNGKPLYGDNCTHCMACICGCPTEAIEYKKHTVGKQRYYNTSSPEPNE